MNLSKLVINTDSSQGRQDLGNPYNLHRTIMRAFPTPLAKTERVLFRAENTAAGKHAIVLVQSAGEPSWEEVSDYFPEYFACAPQVRSLDGLLIRTGDLFRFRTRVSISKRVKYKEDGKSKRISLFSEKDRVAWLERKAKMGGFSIDPAQLVVRDAPFRNFIIRGGKETHHATLNMVDVDGVLRVKDHERFIKTIEDGIGPAKGLGCGLISLAK